MSRTNLKADLATIKLLQELKSSDDVIATIDQKIEEFNNQNGYVHILNDVLGTKKVEQLINNNQKFWMDWGYTYEGTPPKKKLLPKIDCHFSLVDGKGDSVICLTLCYHTDTNKWEQKYGEGELYDTYEEMIEKEFDGNYEYEYDYANIYL